MTDSLSDAALEQRVRDYFHSFVAHEPSPQAIREFTSLLRAVRDEALPKREINNE